ncbi:CHAT domain-containing protein, partial [Fulvivirga sp. RKSG066]|uniref:CHAT domain-containing protein n=1 Tax=Fulvivirga aurantia TaxID=2529383 RepID=UPI0012BB8D0E
LVISTNGILDQFPFGALIVQGADSDRINYKKLKYLGLLNPIKRTHTAKMYLNNNRPFKEDDFSVLSYAFSSDETLKNNMIQGFKELPGSLSELLQLQKMFGLQNVTSRAGIEAKKDQFLSDLDNKFDIIHLALHATSSTQDKLENKIFFRTSTGSYDSLYGYELLSHQVLAKLVVLSACESALGKDVVGEGTYSLSRAFMQAGTEHVVASLWEQVDFSSRLINRSFYLNLKEGSNLDQSLLKAKRDYVAQANKYNSHPAYWAGIVVF